MDRWQKRLDPVEVLPGLSVDPYVLGDELGADFGEAFLHAGLAIIERAIREARDRPWWNGLPGRVHDRLEHECRRGLMVIEAGARIQAAQTDFNHALTQGDLNEELLRRARERGRKE